MNTTKYFYLPLSLNKFSLPFSLRKRIQTSLCMTYLGRSPCSICNHFHDCVSSRNLNSPASLFRKVLRVHSLKQLKSSEDNLQLRSKSTTVKSVPVTGSAEVDEGGQTGRNYLHNERYHHISNAAVASNTKEGPVVHHSSYAAVVLTNSNFINGITRPISEIDSSFKSASNTLVNAAEEIDAEYSSQPGGDAASTIQQIYFEDQVVNVSTERLLSSTVTYVKKIAQDQDLSSSSIHSSTDDVEYIAYTSKTSLPPPVGVVLSGALPHNSLDWRPARVAYAQLPAVYGGLAKTRLTGLVVASAVAGYTLCPEPLSLVTGLGVCAGTALVSAAANAFNQVLEAPYDAQMNRTANRVLVRGLVPPVHAACFAAVCAVAGEAVLWGACGPVTAALGGINLLLYTAVYTPMKRKTIANTWIGAVVGALPPLMGWCGCSGALIGPDAWGAWLMAALLFAWQFPHFNALSWNLQPDYSRAGYRMMCVTNPRLCKATCVRYSLVLLGISFAAPALGVTTWTFAADSAPLNAVMLYLSYRFSRDGDSRSSRNLFRFSLIHLPAILVLMIMSKKYGHATDNEQQLGDGAEGSSGDVAAVAATSQYSSKVVYNKYFNSLSSKSTGAAAPAVAMVEAQILDSHTSSDISNKSNSSSNKVVVNLTELERGDLEISNATASMRHDKTMLLGDVGVVANLVVLEMGDASGGEGEVQKERSI